MAKEIKNMGASVRARLRNIHKDTGQDYQLLLTRYANERLLYRVAKSTHADRFVLKGAMLLVVWFDNPVHPTGGNLVRFTDSNLARPTVDIDLLGYGDPDSSIILEIFKDILSTDVDDGVRFNAENARIGHIRANPEYGGLRIKTTAYVSGARVSIIVDIGFGDITEPKPQVLELSGLLDMPTATLRGYAFETVIAEKFHAMVRFGDSNTRIKDYYDVWLLSQSIEFDDVKLGRAIAATFAQRGTPIPTDPPEALTQAFSLKETSKQRWMGLVEDISYDPGSLSEVIKVLVAFLMPVAEMARKIQAESKPSK